MTSKLGKNCQNAFLYFFCLYLADIHTMSSHNNWAVAMLLNGLLWVISLPLRAALNSGLWSMPGFIPVCFQSRSAVTQTWLPFDIFISFFPAYRQVRWTKPSPNSYLRQIFRSSMVYSMKKVSSFPTSFCLLLCSHIGSFFYSASHYVLRYRESFFYFFLIVSTFKLLWQWNWAIIKTQRPSLSAIGII